MSLCVIQCNIVLEFINSYGIRQILFQEIHSSRFINLVGCLILIDLMTQVLVLRYYAKSSLFSNHM